MSEKLSDIVKEKYAKLIRQKVISSGIASECCPMENSAAEQVTSHLYKECDRGGMLGSFVALSLGCGNPTALGPLYAGEVVLDLGSGAGLDAMLSAKRVGMTGKVYGLDMTDEMLKLAKENQKKAGFLNVEFLKGQIEAIPLENESVDVVISNCVLNLSGNKEKVMQEIYRVLKVGGRLAVSDIVLTKVLPQKIQEKVLSWAGCLAGVLTEEDYRTKLGQAGMKNVEIVITQEYDFTDLNREANGIILSDEEANLAKGALVSAFIRAKKPAKILREGLDYRIRQADKRDYVMIESILRANDLPLTGVKKHLAEFIVAEQETIVGVIGSLRKNEKDLIRSFAVVPSVRKAGIGRALVQSMTKRLKLQGVNELYLLTETAKDYFENLGFTNIMRDEIPLILLQESGLNQVCPCSSHCLKRLL